MAIHGVGGPNAPWTEIDFLKVTAARADCVKLFWYHTAEDVLQLRKRGVDRFLVRLPRSVADDHRWKGLEEWYAECGGAVRKFMAVGIDNFELDTEPNETWPATKHALDNYEWLTRTVAERLVRDFPGVRLGLAPLAWSAFKHWGPVESLWAPVHRRLRKYFHFACINSYWQASGHFNNPNYGGSVTHFHDILLPDMELVVTEWGCSSHEAPLLLPPLAVENQRIQDYPRWQSWIDTKSYVRETYLYIIGGEQRWRGFWPTDRVLRAL